MTARNPKQEGSLLYDAIPQKGPCPLRCNQCFYNRPGAFYTDIHQPHMPDPAALPPDAIVRINSGHDSNIDRTKVIAAAQQYPRRFYNTSIPRFDFDAPVVFTANPKEERFYYHPPDDVSNIMFVRLRVSPTNRRIVDQAVKEWTDAKVPVVLTFMRYYDHEPGDAFSWDYALPAYVFKQHILNSYWCPTREFMKHVMDCYTGNSFIEMCGTLDSSLCKDCGNCSYFYNLATVRNTLNV